MPKTRTVVKTEESLQSELGKLAEQFLQDWFKEKDCDLVNAVLASMMVVEKYSATITKLESADKFQAAQALIPIIVDIAVKSGKISEEEGVSLKKKLARSAELIKSLIEGFVLVSRHPAYIQLAEIVEEKARGCFAMCRGKNK